MNKHLEVKTYEYCGIKVTVRIDFDKKEISLVEKSSMDKNGYIPREYVFANRGLEYMKGWENILEALSYAMAQSSRELEEYLDAKTEDKVEKVAEMMKVAKGKK